MALAPVPKPPPTLRRYCRRCGRPLGVGIQHENPHCPPTAKIPKPQCDWGEECWKDRWIERGGKA